MISLSRLKVIDIKITLGDVVQLHISIDALIRLAIRYSKRLELGLVSGLSKHYVISNDYELIKYPVFIRGYFKNSLYHIYKISVGHFANIRRLMYESLLILDGVVEVWDGCDNITVRTTKELEEVLDEA